MLLSFKKSYNYNYFLMIQLFESLDYSETDSLIEMENKFRNNGLEEIVFNNILGRLYRTFGMCHVKIF